MCKNIGFFIIIEIKYSLLHFNTDFKRPDFDPDFAPPWILETLWIQIVCRKGILYYNLVTADSVGCWNSRTHYSPRSQGVIEHSKERLNFPNDLKLDSEPEQSLWVLSNRLHKYLYQGLDPREVNFRLLTVPTAEAIQDTVCEPGARVPYEHIESNCPP